MMKASYLTYVRIPSQTFDVLSFNFKKYLSCLQPTLAHHRATKVPDLWDTTICQ